MWSRQDTGAASTVKNTDDPAPLPLLPPPETAMPMSPGEESAPAEPLGYEPDIPVVPDAHFPPVSVIREGVCSHRHLSRATATGSRNCCRGSLSGHPGRFLPASLGFGHIPAPYRYPSPSGNARGGGRRDPCRRCAPRRPDIPPAGVARARRLKSGPSGSKTPPPPRTGGRIGGVLFIYMKQ